MLILLFICFQYFILILCFIFVFFCGLFICIVYFLFYIVYYWTIFEYGNILSLVLGLMYIWCFYQVLLVGTIRYSYYGNYRFGYKYMLVHRGGISTAREYHHATINNSLSGYWNGYEEYYWYVLFGLLLFLFCCFFVIFYFLFFLLETPQVCS